MNTYVMSDIHGCYDAFQKMLDKINFAEQDQVILAGDYVDRGTQNLQMLQWIENAPDNVQCIRGNHDVEFSMYVDLMCQVIANANWKTEEVDSEKLKRVYSYIRYDRAVKLFDHHDTIKGLIEEHHVSIQELIRWKQMIDAMPYYLKMNINDVQHVIVHAGYMTDEKMQSRDMEKYPKPEHFYLTAREDAFRVNGLKNAVCVMGHTPTILGGAFGGKGEVFEYRNPFNQVIYYDIDCGIAYRSEKHPQAKLACLRLEDKKKFYV